MNGGYDEGYKKCPCFWGMEPGSMVKMLNSYLPNLRGINVLDAGCGEGKNAAYLAKEGALVDAIDVSESAIANGIRVWSQVENITWTVGDVRSAVFAQEKYQLVIAYGLLHCFRNEAEVKEVVIRLKGLTSANGINIVCAFNNRRQELIAHPGFTPTLLEHERYLQLYNGWQILMQSDTDLTEVHPNNNIKHTHSMTRIIARKT